MGLIADMKQVTEIKNDADHVPVDGVVWPRPDALLYSVEESLRLGFSISRAEAIFAADVLEAYRKMICEVKAPSRLIKELRKPAPEEDPTMDMDRPPVPASRP